MSEKKFYVLTSGEYSDYHIVAVTDSKEVAEQIQKRFLDQTYPDDVRIETFVNATVYKMGVYKVEFSKTGKTYVCICSSDYEFEDLYRGKKHIGVPFEEVNPWNREKVIKVFVEANSEEEAIKIAAERKAEYLAEKSGI